MQRISRITACALALLLWNAQAWSQRGGHVGGMSGGRGGGSGAQGGSNGRGGGGQAAPSSPGTPSGVQGGMVFGVRPPAPPAGAINPGFPSGLGNNVGMRAFPPVVLPPGVGNINQPGLPPGSPTFIPNINNPGQPYVSGAHPGLQPQHRGHSKGPFVGSGPVIYGGPYFYSPYLYSPYMGYSNFYPYQGYPSYAETPPPSSYSSPEQPPEAPEPAKPNGPQTPYFLPETQPQQEPPATTPEAKPVTLLAFKDHTIVAVTDYWLQGDSLYYATSYGGQTGIPIEQLDFPLTQQLNRERNLKFVLESRP